ncbi:MAG: citrate transporter [Ruminococcaceae bacterium]|nr:citrate transporter [Oscillospiraceae bacterium]
MILIKLFKKHTVLCIATLAAIITAFFIPPSLEYIEYFDFNTLSCLFLTLAVVCALRNIKFFTILARRIVMLTGNLKMLALSLVYITFIGSLLIANDMALITFLPLGFFALSVTKQEKYMAYVFILQNISANLGGMLTPFGNPQNLYLYSAFNIPTGEFISIMFLPSLLAVAMLTLFCLFLPSKKLSINESFPEVLNGRRTALYLALFAMSLLIVFRVIPFWLGLIIIPTILFIADRDALKAVDYPLLLTFVMFFIFAGNMAKIDAVNSLASALLEKSTLLVSIISCQFISNVPSAILLSRFTENYRELLLGVNIGGTGTIIASLASLITFSEYRLLHPGDGKRYFVLFTIINLIFLAVLTVIAYLFFI